MADFAINVSTSKRRYGYGEAIHLQARIANTSGRTQYLVLGRVYPAEPMQAVMTILHGQVGCGPNCSYFAFRPPELRRLGAGQKTEIDFSVAMPLHRYGPGSDGLYKEWEVPISGNIKLAVSFGYLPKPFRPNTAGSWGEFMRLQKISPAKTVTVKVLGP